MKDLLKQLETDKQTGEKPLLPQMVTTDDIAKAIRKTKRTVHRRIHCPKNPLPPACIKRDGSDSLWDKNVVIAWLERERNLGRCSNYDQSASDEGGDYE